MTTVSLKLPDPLAVKLNEAARNKCISKSALIRDALESYLHGNEAAGRDSALVRAAELRGTLAGPEDLSSNPLYIKNFGR